MNKSKQEKPSGGQEKFLIFMVVGVGILATLSLNIAPPSAPPSLDSKLEDTGERQKGQRKSVSLTDVPFATGNEPLEKLFVQSGCAVCHTIPGIAPAKGRQGPLLALGTNGPIRLADPEYSGTANSVREYIQESILQPGVYVVPGYSDRVMPRWYGTRLNAKTLDRMTAYLEMVTVR